MLIQKLKKLSISQYIFLVAIALMFSFVIIQKDDREIVTKPSPTILKNDSKVTESELLLVKLAFVLWGDSFCDGLPKFDFKETFKKMKGLAAALGVSEKRVIQILKAAASTWFTAKKEKLPEYCGRAQSTFHFNRLQYPGIFIEKTLEK